MKCKDKNARLLNEKEIVMRILLSENEQALSKALKAILERNNYSVDTAGDGREALDYLEADNYDGVILDIMMPKVDGKPS